MTLLIRQQADSDREFRKRRRISRANTRVRDRRENSLRRELRSFWFKMARSIMGRVEKVGVVGFQVDDIFRPDLFREEFSAKLLPQLHRTLWTGIQFESEFVASMNPEQAYDGAMLVRQVQGPETPPRPDEVQPPFDIKVEPSAKLKRDIASVLRDRDVGVWRQVSGTTRQALQDAIQKGVDEGDTFSQMIKRIRSTAKGLRRQQPLAIARTECLPGCAVVDGANVKSAHRRFYEGPFVEIVTHAGRKFAGTPNHPMLTTRGLVGLGDLKESDHLVCDSRCVQPSGSSGDEDVNAPPPTIAEVFDSLSAVAVASRKRTRQPDFHGDGMDGNVDILTADGVLPFGVVSPLSKREVNQVLAPAGLAQGLAGTHSGTFGRSVVVAYLSRLLRVAVSSASIPNSSRDSILRHTVLLGKLVDRLSGFVFFSDLVAGQVNEARMASAVLKPSYRRLTTRPDIVALFLQDFVNSAGVQPDRLCNGRGADAIQIHIDNLVGLFLWCATNLCSILDGPLRYSALTQHAVNARDWDVELSCDSCATGAALDIHLFDAISHLLGNLVWTVASFRPRLFSSFTTCIANNPGAGTQSSGDGTLTQPGPIELDSLASRRVRRFSGHVYNLTTDEGVFVCNGLYTGNTVNAMNTGEQFEREELGIERKSWISVISPRNRGATPGGANHIRPDGQTVHNDKPFRLVRDEGGVDLLRWPADGSLGARLDQIVLCRCSSVAALT